MRVFKSLFNNKKQTFINACVNVFITKLPIRFRMTIYVLTESFVFRKETYNNKIRLADDKQRHVFGAYL